MRKYIEITCALILGLLLVVAVEGGLRLIWSPVPLPGDKMVWVEIDPFSVENRSATLRQEFVGTLLPNAFPVPKPEGEFRIVCLGGSSTLGYPYTVEYAWPAVLEKRLQKLYPQKSVRVLNLGGTSYGSARSLSLMHGMLKYEPDLFIVYSGHNEFVEDSFRVVLEQDQSRFVLFVNSLRLTRLLRKVIPSVRTAENVIDTEEARSRGVFFVPQLDGTVYEAAADKRQDVLIEYRDNLQSMASLAKEAGVRVVFTTLPANLASWPPSGGLSQASESDLLQLWQEQRTLFNFLAAENSTEAALLKLRQQAGKWKGNAAICYGLGQLAAANADMLLARFWLSLALELDPEPVRASQVFNDVVGKVARTFEIPLVDLEKIFSESSQGGLVDESLILDHVHPTPEGHLLIARSLWAYLSRTESNWSEFSTQVDLALRQEEDRQLARQHLMNSNIAMVMGQVFLKRGLPGRAAEMLEISSKLDPGNPFAQINLAKAYMQQARYTEAREELETVTARYPKISESYPLLGWLYYQAGEGEKADSTLDKALKLGNKERSFLVFYAEFLLRERAWEKSVSLVAVALQSYPEDCFFVALQGRVLENTSGDKAIEDYYSQYLQQNQGCQEVWENLAVFQIEAGRWKEAEQTLLKALALAGSSWPIHKLNLGYVYYKGLSDKELAMQYFSRYLMLQSDGDHNIPPELLPAVREIVGGKSNDTN